MTERFKNKDIGTTRISVGCHLFLITCTSWSLSNIHHNIHLKYNVQQSSTLLIFENKGLLLIII